MQIKCFVHGMGVGQEEEREKRGEWERRREGDREGVWRGGKEGGQGAGWCSQGNQGLKDSQVSVSAQVV